MKNNHPHNYNLTILEKTRLRKSKIKIREIADHSVEELRDILHVSELRAMEIFALYQFQSIPSIGEKFAHDLIMLGYYSLSELQDKSGAKLIDDLEQLTGAWIDPCVEDQCRLVVHYANNRRSDKSWWDFTDERKQYRAENGYPETRPKAAWYDLEKYQHKK